MKRKKESLHDKAIRLVEGGIVQVDGHAVRAIKAPIDENPCDVCEMDCLCHRLDNTEMAYLCEDVDVVGRDGYYLKLVLAK